MSSDSRPAKRQRRGTLQTTEDDTSSARNALPLRRTETNSATTSKNSRSVKTNQLRSKTSPTKFKAPVTQNDSPSKNKSIQSFFTKASDEDRWKRAPSTPTKSKSRIEIEDDIVDDDDDYDEVFAEAIRQEKSGAVRIPPRALTVSKSTTSSVPSYRHKFVKPAVPQTHTLNSATQNSKDDQDKPWSDRYGPTSLDELAVHKKKLQDVERALEGMLQGRIRQRLLVLKGPAGCGKSTTIKLLSKSQRFDIITWQNPDDTDTGAGSSSVQFADFISRGGDYSALSLESDDAVLQPSMGKRRVLLVEEYPASLSNNSSVLESFRSVLLQAAASTKSLPLFGTAPDVDISPPIVMIVSETMISSSTSYSDSFTAQRLLGPELLLHPALTLIEFNKVAPTFLSKALDLVIKKEARDSRRRRVPGPGVLQKLAEIGDVRNAVNTLQFLCTKGDDDGEWSGTVAGAIKRAGKQRLPLTPMEVDSLKLITARETSLDMFHAAGKVCYNKREDPRVADPKAEPAPSPPDHLKHRHKPKVSTVDFEDLLNETGTDIQTFVSTVHQNYALSCNHIDFVDYLDGCAATLSDAELLDAESHTRRSRARAQAHRSTAQAGNTDALRQDEISFQVATRGVIFNLPSPVSRVAPPNAGKAAAFKMYYPEGLRLWKPIEDTEGKLDLIISRLAGVDAARRGYGSNDGGVATWRIRAGFTGGGQIESEIDTTPVIPRTELGRDNLLLEILPYMARIRVSEGEPFNTVKKIVQFSGFHTNLEGEPPDHPPGMSPENNVTFKNKAFTRSWKMQGAKQEAQQRLEAKQMKQIDKLTAEALPAAKLYLEEDDIVDD